MMNQWMLMIGLLAGFVGLGRAGGFGPEDWPGWRGPNGDGKAAPDQDPPLHWSETENVRWKAPIPGKGHGSPTLVGDFIYLPTADETEEALSVICLKKSDGKRVWQSEVHRGKLYRRGHRFGSQASGSVQCDGERLFVAFLIDDAVFLTALSFDGTILWQEKVDDFVGHQGFGASPVVHGPLVIIAADHRGGGVVAAYERETGKMVWSQPRPEEPNYTSPAVIHAAGRDQLVLAGCDLLASYDPLTGRVLWETQGSTTECVVTMVTDGERVFAGGGYPRNHTVAVNAANGEVVWQNGSRVYVPSMLVQDGHVFAVMDAGFAVCWKADTGEEMWKERLGGDFFASPVMVGNRIYASNVRGKSYVFEADPQRHRLLAENQLGDEMYASPVICGNRIYMRVADLSGDERQEFLYCLSR